MIVTVIAVVVLAGAMMQVAYWHRAKNRLNQMKANLPTTQTLSDETDSYEPIDQELCVDRCSPTRQAE